MCEHSTLFSIFFEKMISKKVINDTVFAFFVSCVIGEVILVAIPGNYVRLEHISSGTHNILSYPSTIFICFGSSCEIL